jgi:hypothetical protein
MPAVVEIIRFPDPVARAISFLSSQLPASIWLSQDVPAERAEEMVIVTDTGGAGVYDHAFDEARLTVDVWAADSPRASELARTVFGLLHAWPGLEAGVYRRRGWSRPAYLPDPPTRIPRYVMTVQLSFRGAAVEVGTDH